MKIHPCGGKELYSAEAHTEEIRITEDVKESFKKYFKVLVSPDNQFMMLEDKKGCRILIFSTGRIVIRMASSEDEVKKYFRMVEEAFVK